MKKIVSKIKTNFIFKLSTRLFLTQINGKYIHLFNMSIK